MKARDLLGMRVLAVAAVSLAALLLVAAVGAETGTGPQVLPPNTHGPSGIVRPDGPGQNGQDQNGQGQNGGAGQDNGPDPQAAGTHGGAGVTNMTYHGGPVMHTNTVYLIFWAPPGSGGFQQNYMNTITQYFHDVANDSTAGGNTTPATDVSVYSIDPQYGDPGAAQYNTTFGGSVLVTDAPASNNSCLKVYGSSYALTNCVTDTDIQSEVSKVMGSPNNWAPGLGNIFFVFTPKSVGSCYGNSVNDCAYTAYCAYHSYYSTTGNQPVLYANQPYTDDSSVSPSVAGDCDSGQQPNGNWADETISVASHEQNETITDPLINAWYYGNYDEIGDLCAWNFGTALGGTAGAEYNQIYGNGDKYYVQQEWSNAQNGCAQSYTPPEPPTISGFSPGTGGPGTPVTISGMNFTGATAVEFNGVSAATFSVGSNGSTITATVPSGASSGPISVTTPVSTATSSASFMVTPAADFSFAVSGSPRSIKRGQSTTYSVSITRLNGFIGTVSLSVGGLPGGAKASFSPSSIVGPSATSSTLMVSTRNNSPRGTFTLTVTGTSGSLKHSQMVTLTLN